MPKIASISFILLWLLASIPNHATAVPVPPTVIRFIPHVASSDPNKVSMASVEVSGQISGDAPARLKEVLAVARSKTNMRTRGGAPAIHVYLDSPGGNVLAAMRMGRLLRASGAEAWVRPGKTCASACVLVLAGGVERLAFDGARIGIHRPYFEPAMFAGLSQTEAQVRYKALSEGVRAYLTDLGISDRLYQQMIRVPSHKMVFLTEEEASEMSLLGEDPGFAEWDRARASEKYVPEFLEWNDCLMEGGSEEKCAEILKRVRRKN